MQRTVLANGTFDILHPGHIHYLRESAAHGDRLVVVIARDSRASAKKDSRAKERKEQLCMGEEARKTVVDALEIVDEAILGSEESIFDTVASVEPDIITLGYDQDFDEDRLGRELRSRGFTADVVRIGKGGDFSSSDMKQC
ncbi:MAG: adenylyltransferase/cytidyltransferase family protein [Candidatus Nanohaloarchaea archaeon]|nr:adenylyltransferase/cytidyltransferase family protein [Candidatus Nanohaloarchaea archaeon]